MSSWGRDSDNYEEMKVIKIRLPSNVPNFCRILTINTKISDKKFKVINTILGKRLLIKTIINTRVIYEGELCSGEVFYYYEKTPFFAVIPYDSLIKSAVVANGGIESIYFNNREIQLSVLISVYIYKYTHINKVKEFQQNTSKITCCKKTNFNLSRGSLIKLLANILKNRW